ncbi:hypothetical protein L3X38_027890 [Prunus dulcis]|uniref:CCHC-type domain-containing protein n=1 Tax=Prunus dulcis TaxID=3755 RepID=A0AAD4Z1K0_PRUDU|nr:hypothetical protein L3X38_027890 [Prunus dulcis]
MGLTTSCGNLLGSFYSEWEVIRGVCEVRLCVFCVNLGNVLCKWNALICCDAVMSEEGCEVLSETQKSLQVKLKLLKDGPINNEVGGSSSQTQYMKDHKRVRCKGRSKGVTGAKEKAMKRGIRHCRECGHIGHDRRQCPALNTP